MDRDKAVPAELPALRAAMVQLRGSILTFLSTILVIRQPTKWHGKLIPGGRVRRWIVIARDLSVMIGVCHVAVQVLLNETKITWLALHFRATSTSIQHPEEYVRA